MAELFRAAGFEQAGLRESADVYVINSCAITREAESKARQIASSVKGRVPGALVALAGCYATRLGGETLKNIDIYVAQEDKERIVEICMDYLKAAGRLESAPGRDAGGENDAPRNSAAVDADSRTRAQLKIQDGCRSFCSYCIVPYIRKNEYSMPPEEVIAAIGRLVAAGYREVVLTGIHIGKYCVKDIYGGAFGFEQLLKAIDLYPFGGDFRVRLSSIDPSELSERMILLMKHSPRFAPHFHVALQSGSDRILKLMNRSYGRSEFVEKILMIKENIELPALTSDVIVGFPGETEADFEDTYNLLDELDFYDFHIFQYSDRPGTAASRMDNKVDPDRKKERSKRLHELKYKKNRMYYERSAGREALVVVEKAAKAAGEDGTTILSGHTERYVEAFFEGDGSMAGKMVRVKLLAASPDRPGMLATLL